MTSKKTMHHPAPQLPAPKFADAVTWFPIRHAHFTRIRPFAVLLAIALAVCVAVAPSPASAQDGAVFRTDLLRIATQTGVQEIHIEIAETPRQRAQGLMWRRHLPPGTGMLFDFKIENQVVMWMKNTYIPLDMLFITKNGIILNIARNTTPHSTDYIPSAGPVRAVLELPAGAARKYGIRAGDRVAHAIFRP